MNRKLAGLAAAVLVAGLAAAPSAKAVTLTIDRVPGYFSGNGGEFNIAGTGYETYYNALATVNQGFESFCLEVPETVSLPGVYDYTVGAGAIAGGNAGGNPDPVSAGTAWLYTRFAAGTLGIYNYGVGRGASAAALQECIWYLEQEINSISAGNIFYNSLVGAGKQFASLGLAQADDTVGAVQVLNLTLTVNGQDRNYQSQLVMTRDPTQVLPDAGATVALLGMALMGMGLVGRKSR